MKNIAWKRIGLCILGLSLALTPVCHAAPQAKLAWTDYPAGTVYDGVIIQRKPMGGVYAEIGRVPKNTTTFVDATPTTGTTYCWVVIGFLGTVNAPPSAEVCGGTLPALSGLTLSFQ